MSNPVIPNNTTTAVLTLVNVVSSEQFACVGASPITRVSCVHATVVYRPLFM